MMRRPSGLGLQHAAVDLAIGKTIQPASGCGWPVDYVVKLKLDLNIHFLSTFQPSIIFQFGRKLWMVGKWKHFFHTLVVSSIISGTKLLMVVALTNRMTSGTDVCARTVLTKSFFASQSACEAMKR